MPRNSPKNALCNNTMLTEVQLERLILCWALHQTVEQSVEHLDREFGIPAGRQHLIGKDGVADFFRDFGDYLWVVEGYGICVKLCKLMNSELGLLKGSCDYPHIDPHIQDILEISYSALTVDQQSDVGRSPLASFVVRGILRRAGGTSDTPVANLLAYSFENASGFSVKRAHGHLARAFNIGFRLEEHWTEYEAKDKHNALHRSCLLLVPDMIASMRKYRLREQFPQGSFAWASDGWTRY